MEPEFKDEQLVWIEQTECLESGDIGEYSSFKIFGKLAID